MGIDLHKETHTAVMLDCWNKKLGEITFENKPSEFSKLMRKVSRFVTEGKEPVYGLENAYGYGRALAVWLIEKGFAVKDVNTALSYAQRKSVPMYQKSDSYDAEAVALVLINMLDKLPDAIPDDKYWTLSHNNCSVKRAEKILSLVQADGDTKRDHQESRDTITRSLVSDLEHYRVQLEEVNQAIETIMPEFNCTLMTIPGIDLITAANMLSEIGNISRFPSAAKLAKFAAAPSQFLAAWRPSWRRMLNGMQAQLRQLPARMPRPPNICPWMYSGFEEFSDSWKSFLTPGIRRPSLACLTPSPTRTWKSVSL